MYYQDLETESRDSRLKRKWKAVRNVLHKGEESSREFNARLKELGACSKDFKSFDDFIKIPPLRKQEIVARQKEHGLDWFLACKPGELRRIYQSPGPIYDPEGAQADYWAWSEAFFAAGFRPGDLAQMTFSYHMTPAGLMLEEPLRNIGCAVIPAGPGNTEKQIEFLTELPVTGFVGMASYLKVIGEKARKAGFDLTRDFRLRTAFVAAEKLTETLRGEVEEMFGMRVRQGYGTADVGCIAYECEHLGGMHVSSHRWVEICDPVTGLPLPMGETGEVVVTPFFEDYPLVRLATGDLSSFVEGECVCGRTSIKLDGWKGRADDTCKVKGQFLYPLQIAGVIAKFPQIRAGQVVVTNPEGRDTLTALLDAEGGVPQGFEEAFQAALKLRPTARAVEPGSIAEGSPLLRDDRKFE